MGTWQRRARRLGLTVTALGLTVVGGLFGVGCALSAPTWRGPTTDHFDGHVFHTPGAPTKVGGFSDGDGWQAFFKWQRERAPGPWGAYREEPPGPPPPAEVPHGALRVTFINHATTLIQIDGVNVLTDPIYSERASPFSFAGPKRVRPPGIRFRELPRIDAVVISHNHYDHLDLATLRRIADTWPNVRIFAGLGNKAYLDAKGLPNVTELDWWDSRPLKSTRVHSVPSQHFSNRGFFDQDGTLWTAWVLEGAKGRVYFGGDTGYGPHFKEVGARLGPFRAAVLPIGAYRPEWFMGPIHMAPADAVRAVEDLRAEAGIPMHYGTFPLADDGETEAVEALEKALTEHPLPFFVLGFGEGRDL